MRTYPIMLNVTGRVCVVVGAGPVGLRKAEALLRAGASVRLVDPGDGAGAPEGVEHLRHPYEPSVLDGAFLAFACTDEAPLNARIAADARSRRVLVNVADVPDLCDFYAASTVTDGDVVIAVGTCGTAPALARRLRRLLADAVPDRVGEFADALGRLRGEVIERVDNIDRRRAIFQRLASAEGYEAFLQGGIDALARLVERDDY